MKRFLKNFTLLLCSSLFAMTGWAETIAVNQEIIGINFSRNDAALSTTLDVLYGYQSETENGTQGGLLAERAWQSFYAENNSNPLTTGQAYPITTAGNPSLNITLTKNSNNNVWGPNSNKLFGSYLDEDSDLTFQGLPTSGYDVAIIFAGDTDSSGTCDKYSSVEVNEVSKTYNEQGDLVTGTSPWGLRVTTDDANLTRLTETGTSTTGQVMYLSGMTSSRLHIKTKAQKNNDVGRGTIAAIQIYIKPGTIEKTFAELPEPTWVWDGKKDDGTSCEVLTTLPVGPAYKTSSIVKNISSAEIPATSFTLSCWVKCEAKPQWQNYLGIGGGENYRYLQLQRGANDTNDVHVFSDEVNRATVFEGLRVASTSDAFQFFTFVVDTENVTVYVNGTQTAQAAIDNTLWNRGNGNMKYVAFGCAPDAAGNIIRPFEDIPVADARIYSAALSAEQVAALYYVKSVTPTYWATFNGDALTSDKVSSEDGFSLQGEALSFITVSGSNKAWNVSGNTYGTQSVLNTSATTFTLSVNAKMGTTPNGLLFAFGNKDNGGLALRRTDADHVVLTTGTSTDPVLTGEAIACDVNYYNYTIVAVAGKLRLYINGVPVKDGEGNIVEVSATNLITTNNFQPGRRHGGLLGDGEQNGNGAIDEMVIWKDVALSSVLVKNTHDLFLKTAIVRRTLATAEENWSDAEWNDGNDAAPTQGQVMLTSNVNGGSTLTMDASATLNALTFTGETPVTIAASNTNKLTSSNTRVATDTTVNAGAASLGAVALADGKTLTVKNSATVDSVVGGTLAIDATAGGIEFTTGTALTLDEIRQYTGKIKILGSDVNGGTLAYGTSEDEFKSHLIFDNGTHTFKYGRGKVVTFATGAKNDNPTIWVTNKATLNFYGKDLSGWAGGDASNTGIIRVDNGSTLNFFKNGGTFYYRQRLYLEPGATMTIADTFGTDFRLHGGVATAETAQLYVPSVKADAKEKDATISGGMITFAKDDTNGLGFFVGANATLKITSPFTYDTDDGKASPIAKYGDGTLLLTGGYEPTGDITIDAGTLALGFTGALTNAIANNATFAADGEGVVMNLTGAKLSGSGTYVARNGAILKLSLTQAKNNKVAANGGKVYIELTAEEQESAQTITTVDGTFQFVDANNNPLSRPNTDYVLSNDRTYDVVEGAWDNDNKPSDFDRVVIAFGDAAGEVDLSEILGDVTALSKLTITGSNGGTITNVADVATCTAIVLETATTMPAELAALAGTIESTATLSIVGGTETVDVSGVISGEIQVKIVSGKVTFSGVNAYTGGTYIAEGATLTISNANALGPNQEGNEVSGAGILSMSVYPAVSTESYHAQTTIRGLNNANWTGCLRFESTEAITRDGMQLSVLGNVNSRIEIVEGTTLSGYFANSNWDLDATLILNGVLNVSDGFGGKVYKFTGPVTGNGTLELDASGTPNDTIRFTADTFSFAGAIEINKNNRSVVIGPEATSRFDGKIVIAKPVTIAATKTWTAVNGIAIMDGATLTVNGEITGAIDNAGTLVYVGEQTPTNTIANNGKIVADGTGTVVNLTDTPISGNGTYRVTNGATLTLPLTATTNKTIEVEGATLEVVLNDVQKAQTHEVTVTGSGTVQFVDANGNILCNGASYTAPIYTVGEGWTGANRFAGASIVIDFAETEGEKVDLTEILGSVTTLSKLTVTGTNGGTITNSTVTACPTVVITSGGRTVMPAALLNLATTVTPSTVEGALLYVTGETTSTAQTFPYSGNRHFETIKFMNQDNVGGDIDNYTIAENETMLFTHGNVRYMGNLTLDGGLLKTQGSNQAWFGGATNKCLTIKSGIADLTSIKTDNSSSAVLIGYSSNHEHTLGIQGGLLDASYTSIVGWEANSKYSQSGGLVKTKGFRQNGSNFTEMTLTGGTIELGSGGLPNLGMASASIEATTIHAVANNIVAEALNMTGNATLSAAANTTMTVTSTFTGEATLSIAGAGTVDLSGATIPNTIALNVAAESTATVLVSAEQLTTFAQVIVPEGATLKVKETYTINEHLAGGRKEYTVGEGSTIAGNVVWEGLTGTTNTSLDGTTLTLTFAANPTLTGNAWWWDYEFNNNSLANDGSADDTALTNNDGILSGNAAFTTADDEGNQMLKLPARPWRDVSEWPTEATFVMYTKAGATANGMLVSFGSSQDTGTMKSITLMTGANPKDGDMRLVYAKGTDNNSVVDLVKNLSVPNATDAYHLYAFVLESVENNTKTHISIYVDGGLVATYTADSIIQLGGGFQIASVHGNGPTDLKHLENDDTATMDFLRVSNTVLSADAMQSLANAYPYTSPIGTASRTVASTDAVKTWIGANENECVWTQTTLADDGSGETTDKEQVAPTARSVVKVTVGDTTSVALNIPAEGVSYEALDISESLAGENTLTLAAVQDAGLMTIAGKTSIKANTTIAAGAVKMGAVDVAAGKTLTFDYSAYDFTNVWASIPLTGLASGEGTVAVTFPVEKPAQITNWECVKDPSTSTYAIVVTVDLSNLNDKLAATIENNAITWKVGETVVTPPADLTAVGSITMTVVGDNSVTLTENMTLASVVLTGEGEGNAVTFESGKLTVNNTLTMNNVNVTATPETLVASAVVGTTENDTLTMNASSNETCAMALSNCAFTKSGAGTLTLNPNGIVLNQVVTTLAGGKLELRIGNDDPQIEKATFIYVDADEDGIADGELMNNGWVRSASEIVFDVPEGVVGRAFVNAGSQNDPYSGVSNFADVDANNTASVRKNGGGTLMFGLTSDGDNRSYSGATALEKGTLHYGVKMNGDGGGSGGIGVKSGAAIKGSTNCTLASLIFDAGAIVDATNAPVTATAVTLPGTGTVTVKATNFGDVLKKGDLDTSKFALATGMEGLLVATNAALVYTAKPTLPENTTGVSDETIAEIAQMAAAEGVTNVTSVEGAVLVPAEGNTPAKTVALAGLELFNNVISFEDDSQVEGAKVAIVSYAFGIQSISVNADGNIVVTAKVDKLTQGSGDAPTFANDVTVALYNGTTEIGTAEVVAGSSEIVIPSSQTVSELFAPAAATVEDAGSDDQSSSPSSQTLQLTIKAVKR